MSSDSGGFGPEDGNNFIAIFNSTATAGPTGLRAYSDVAVGFTASSPTLPTFLLGPNNTTVHGASSGASAEARYTDFLITTSGSTAQFVDGQLRLGFSGTNSASVSSDGLTVLSLPAAGASGTGEIIACVGEVGTGGGSGNCQSQTFYQQVATPYLGNPSPFHNDVIPGVVAFDLLQIPVGQPFLLDLQLLANSGVNFNLTATSAFGSASSDFFHTLTFASSGPVFVLPDGFSVDSVDAQISNNQWLGAVPEPSTALLVGFGGIAGLAVKKRRVS